MLEFEAAAARMAGVPHGVAFRSGTAGLHLGLLALGIGEGDEVILPSFTFIAAANAVLHVRARPVFVEIDARTLNLTAESVARVMTPRTRAILVVHTFGCPADLDPILELAARHGVRVIEDACEALGAEYRGRPVGGLGAFGVFAFYPNKPITTGEGGVLVTRDAELAEKVRALRNQGRRPADGWLDHALLGYNYRISEMNCALGRSQLGRLDAILARREDRAACYCEHLRTVPGVILPAGAHSSRACAGSCSSSVWTTRSRRGIATASRTISSRAALAAGATSRRCTGSRSMPPTPIRTWIYPSPIRSRRGRSRAVFQSID